MGCSDPGLPYRFEGFARSWTLRSEMVAALRRYAEHRTPVGDFLTASLSNDFLGAVRRADDDNVDNLPALASYIYNKMPRDCHGSPEAVRAWLHGREGEAYA